MYYGDKVMLRAYRKEDIDKACEFMNDYEMRHFLTPVVPYPLLKEQETKWYENLVGSNESYSFAIEDLDSKEYIGGCGINSVNWSNRTTTVGNIYRGQKLLGQGLWNRCDESPDQVHF